MKTQSYSTAQANYGSSQPTNNQKENHMKKQNIITLKLAAVLAVAIVALALAVPSTSAQSNGQIILGLPADRGVGNCVPFGCAYDGKYQQIYTSSAFTSGPIFITGLEFFNTQVDNWASGMNDGTWAIWLSTTNTHDWNNLSPTYSQNLGPNNIKVFSGNLHQAAWSFGNTLFITLSTGFWYDPTQGNLLMSIDTNSSDQEGVIQFDTNGNNPRNAIMGRVVINGCGVGLVQSGYGLVTGFVTGTPPPCASCPAQ